MSKGLAGFGIRDSGSGFEGVPRSSCIVHRGRCGEVAVHGRDAHATGGIAAGCQDVRPLPSGHGQDARATNRFPGSRLGCTSTRAFTLIELLIVVAIIAILAVIAAFNFREATERALRASNAANLHTLATGLQVYMVDYGRLPPADREAGPFMSHTRDFAAPGNGPASGGSWDGVPWLLYERGYVSNWETLFNPRYLKLYAGRTTLRGDQPRFHNFRYAYNSAALSSGGHAGGDGNIESGTVWMVRDLYLPADRGWHASRYPDYPADYEYPWTTPSGDEAAAEHVMYADLAVRLVRGGTDERLE